MPFDNLRNLLNNRGQFSQLPVAIPGTEGLDPSVSQPQFSGQILQKLMGDAPSKGDAIEPDYNSPIDFLASGVGSKLGSSLAKNAASLLGNEVGSVAPGVKSLVQNQLNSKSSLPEIKSSVSDYLNKQFEPSLNGPHSDHYQKLLNSINKPSNGPINMTGPIEGTPHSLDQAIANSVNTQDPHHVQDFLSQKFTASGMLAPDDLNPRDILNLFDNITGNSNNVEPMDKFSSLKNKLGGE